MNPLHLLFLIGSLRLLPAHESIEKLTLPLIPDLERADLYLLKASQTPSAILVLVPGFNGNGEDWLKNPVWEQFAREHNLDLIGVSFASDGELLKQGRGYYYPAQGSGQLLLDGLHRAFNFNVPLLIYGFSGGAHFTSGFEEWNPNVVMGWGAYSAQWWTPPEKSKRAPPGIVICGMEDERFGSSLLYFKQGRALSKPWLWISVPKNGHSNSVRVEDFVRHYFSSLLERPDPNQGQWVDIDLARQASRNTVKDQPSLTGWLPSSDLMNEWKEINQP